MKEGQTQESGKIFIADFETKILIERATEANSQYTASLKQYPATWLTKEMDGKKMVEGKDFITGKRCEFYKGNYSNTCTLCKEVFHGSDKLWFYCQKCCDETISKPIESIIIESPVKEISAIFEKYSTDAARSVGKGCNHTVYILEKDFWNIIQEIIKTIATPPPAPIKTEGEDENEVIEYCDICGPADRCAEYQQEGNCDSIKKTIVVPLPSPVGIDVDGKDIRGMADIIVHTVLEDRDNEYSYATIKNKVIEIIKAGYAASPKSKNYLEVLKENLEASKIHQDKRVRKLLVETYEDLIAIWQANYDGKIIHTPQSSTSEEAIGERMFTLKEALEIHKSGMLQGICSPEEANNKPDEIQRNYFKNKFSIDI